MRERWLNFVSRELTFINLSQSTPMNDFSAARHRILSGILRAASERSVEIKLK